jgi:YD repeat-containing protein
MARIRPQNNFKTTLAGPITASQVDILLTNEPYWSEGFLVLEPNTDTIEIIKYTGKTGNLVTGCIRGLSFVDSSTEVPVIANQKPHAAGRKVEMADATYYLEQLLSIDDLTNEPQTILDVFTFTNPNYPRMDVALPYPTDSEQLTTKAYVDYLDGLVVHIAGTELIAGQKSFSIIPFLPSFNPTSADEATRKAYVDLLDSQNVKITGAQSVAGVKTFTAYPEMPAVFPIFGTQAASKAYVDAVATGTVPLIAGLNNASGFIYNTKGLLTSVTDDDFAITYTISYDTRDRVTSVSNGTNTWTMTYNALSELISIVKS